MPIWPFTQLLFKVILPGIFIFDTLFINEMTSRKETRSVLKACMANQVQQYPTCRDLVENLNLRRDGHLPEIIFSSSIGEQTPIIGFRRMIMYLCNFYLLILLLYQIFSTQNFVSEKYIIIILK